MSVAPSAGALNSRAQESPPKIRSITPPPMRFRKFEAWKACECPNRPLDSWTIWCTGPCVRCNRAAVAATEPGMDGTAFLRGEHAQRIITRTQPRRRRGGRR